MIIGRIAVDGGAYDCTGTVVRTSKATNLLYSRERNIESQSHCDRTNRINLHHFVFLSFSFARFESASCSGAKKKPSQSTARRKSFTGGLGSICCCSLSLSPVIQVSCIRTAAGERGSSFCVLFSFRPLFFTCVLLEETLFVPQAVKFRNDLFSLNRFLSSSRCVLRSLSLVFFFFFSD